MPRGYKRNFFAVEASILDNEKWMGLSWEDRGKWLAARALAERQTTTDFKSIEYLAMLLQKEGDNAALTTVNTLIDARLLDLNDDGRVTIHDLADYLPPASTERVQRYRETDRNGPKRRETPTDIHTDIPTAGAPASRGDARPREAGETLRQWLERIGTPIPDVAKETKQNGKSTGTESGSNDDGKSGRRTRRRRASTGGGVRGGKMAASDDVS